MLQKTGVGLRAWVEFYFYRDRDGGLTYGIEDWANFCFPDPDDNVSDRGDFFDENVERDAFYARFAATMAEIGCPAFLTGEAQVQGWFESADRADFDEHVAMCMYNAMLRAKHGRTIAELAARIEELKRKERTSSERAANE